MRTLASPWMPEANDSRLGVLGSDHNDVELGRCIVQRVRPASKRYVELENLAHRAMFVVE